MAENTEKSFGLSLGKGLVSWIWPFLALCLFCAAGWLLYNHLSKHSLADFIAAFDNIRLANIYIAIGFTILSYAVLAGYDFSALVYLQKKVKTSRVFLASFIGFSFSQNLGLSPITGGSVRLRIYTANGIAAKDVAKIVAFCILTYSIGITAIFGGVLTFFPDYLKTLEGYSQTLSRVMGVITLFAVLGYILWVSFRHQPIRFKGFEFNPPSAWMSIFQLVLTFVDLGLAASVLYVLLPPVEGLGFVHLFFVYVIATTLGILSHVPGGLGVFEWAALIMLADYYDAPTIIGALLIFRLIYLFLPLVVASLSLLAYETWQKRAQQPVKQ